MSREIPILFSTPMVQALLAGRKTQTRRIITPQPDDSGLHNHDRHPMSVDSKLTGWRGTDESTGESKEFRCKQGAPGDRLWVRESFNIEQYPKAPEGDTDELLFYYKATETEYTDMRWRPSIHMPKIAARIWLEVTHTRVQRLQEISKEEAIAEGIEPVENFNSGEGKYPGQFYRNYLPAGYAEVNALHSFQSLWRSLNGGDSWAKDPWVWATTFKILSTTGKP